MSERARAEVAPAPAPSPIPEDVERTRALLTEAQGEPAIAAVHAALGHVGLWPEVDAALGAYWTDADARRRLEAAKAHPALGEVAADAALPFERALLVRAALAGMSRVATLPVDDSVRRLLLEEFRLYAAPDARRRKLLALDTPTFKAATQVVAFERFPAGQLHWDVSGVSRRSLAQTPARELARLLPFLALRMRGLGPALFGHVNGLRPNPFVWVERESNRSYYRIARSLVHQPRMLGLVLRAWFHAPDVGTVTPHLAWTNRVVVENGGVVVDGGEADERAGFMSHNRERRDAYERGEYKPRYGLVVWPRAALIAWAERNPQFAA